MTFDFKDPKEISAVSLSLDSPLEPIVGYAKGISGTVSFDPADPLRSTGRIAVDVSSVRFANDGYTATAQGYALNGKKWPQLILAIRKVERVRKVSATRYEGVVLADFTCRGVTRPKRLAVTADFLPAKAEERTNGKVKGDLLVLRTHFAVSRKEHGISEGIPDSIVGDTVEVGVAVVGIHTTEGALPQVDRPGGGAGVGGNDVPHPLTPSTWEATPKDGRNAPASPPSADPPATNHAGEGGRKLPRIGGGTPLSLDDVRGKANLVVFFLNEQCGVTHAYRTRLQRLVKGFGTKGFAFVAVRTGRKQFPNQPVDLPERTYLKIPFLDDAGGDLMRKYGIGQSMTFVVLDPRGGVRYQGGLDDSVDEARVKRTPLRDALRELAAGRPVRVARAGALGCAILPVER